MDLREWAKLYVQHKDVIARRLQRTEEEGDHLLFTFKDSLLTAYPMEQLSLPHLEEKSLIVTLHTKANVDTLLKRWKEFAAVKALTIVFVNLGSNEKWLINPHTHHMIADTNLEQGIRSIADNVPYQE
jgi:hypothetical protein